jgi:DNA polymerase (family 10)
MEAPPGNAEIAALFERIADLLEIRGENVFKVNAYRRAAENIREVGRPLAEVRAEGTLRQVPGVGEAIAEKIEELLDTGRLGFYDRLVEEVPESLLELLEVPDMGPKRVGLVWKSLGVTNLAGLSAAASGGRLKGLPGLGEKSEAKIRKGLEDLKGRKIAVRTPLGVAWELAEAVRAALRDAPGLERLETGGSLRRMKETVGDLDFLAAAADAAPVMDRLAESPLVEEVLLRGPTKMSVRFRGGMQGDLRVVERSRWGTAWQYFTGSQAHNVTLRELSIKKGYSLSEYALKKADGSELLCAEEEEVYRALGMPWIPPELREGRGEIEAAIKGELPRLLEVSDLKGDLQSHTTASDGRASLPEMAQTAMERNLAYLLVTDHSQGLAVAGGLSPGDLRRQCAEIRELEKSLGGKFRLLCGTEVEVRSDGSLDFPDDVLGGLDLVVAAVHSALSGDPEKVTGRFLSAVRHPLVHVLAHPTGRLLTGRGRSGADADWDRVFAEAAATGTALEINASPMRLDLTDTLARRALELGCLFAVSTDAHAPEQFDFAHFGVAVARRAWIPPERVVNTWEADRLLEWARGKPARVAALGR